MENSKIDLRMIVREVENRKNRRFQSPGLRPFAIKMVEMAKSFGANPSAATLADFAKSESDWFGMGGSGRVRYADKFNEALQAGCGPVAGNVINNPYNSKYAPPQGFVYAFWTPLRPSSLKIGSTAQHPQDRLQSFQKRFPIDGLQIVFMFKVTQPAAVENRMHQLLQPNQKRVDKHDSREWFEVTPSDACRMTRQAIESLNVKVVGQVYVDKNLDAKSKISEDARRSSKLLPLLVNGNVSHGARRVTKDDVNKAIESRKKQNPKKNALNRSSRSVRISV